MATPGRIRAALAALFFLVAAVCFFLVGLIAWKGGRWEFIVSAGNPQDRLICGVLALFVGYLLRVGLPRTRRAWAGLAGRLVLVGVSTGISLLAAEHLLRLSLRRSQGFGSFQDLADFREGKRVRVRSAHALASIVRLSPSKKLIFELVPNLDRRFGGRSLKTNGHGMRESRDYPESPATNCIRIVGVGDSGMFGWSVHQGQDYLAVLESNLNDRAGAPHYEVLNLAVPGYNTRQEVEMLRERGLAFSPSIVVLGWCDNDVEVPFFLHRHGAFDRKDISYLYAYLFDRERFRRLVRPVVRKLGDIDRKFMDPEVVADSGFQGVKRALQDLRDLGIEHDVRVLVWGPMNKDIEGLCRAIGLPCYNTRREIDAAAYPKEYAVHFMHPRAPGHRVLAEHLERTLEARGWLAPRAAARRGRPDGG
jgi:hypothetical protein